MDVRFTIPATLGHQFVSNEIADELRRGNFWEACCLCCERSYDWQAGLSEF